MIFLLERVEGKEERRVRNFNVREAHQLVSSAHGSTRAREQTCNPGTFHRLEIEPMTLQSLANALTIELTSRGILIYLFCKTITIINLVNINHLIYILKYDKEKVFFPCDENSYDLFS